MADDASTSAAAVPANDSTTRNLLLTLVFACVTALSLVRLNGTGPAVGASSVRQGSTQVRTRINPNTATEAELMVLPGIGPTKARRIVEYRRERSESESVAGGSVFSRPEDLRGVPGIGPKTVQKLADHLRF